MFARDNIRGVMFGGIGEQVDSYVTIKLLDDPSLDIECLAGGIFHPVLRGGAEPMKRFYLRVEDIYSTTANYPEEVQKNHYKQFHQTEEIAWKYLGTEARMAELGKLMDEASDRRQRRGEAARGPVPQSRLGLHGRRAQDLPCETIEKIDVVLTTATRQRAIGVFCMPECDPQLCRS